MRTFAQWLEREGIREGLAPMHIDAAFEVMVSRLDAARAAGAVDPLRAISTRDAGPHSRAATRRMLERLGYSPVQRRSVHRLLAGSPSGWPGLLTLFARDAILTQEQRQYVARQGRYFRPDDPPRGARDGISVA